MGKIKFNKTSDKYKYIIDIDFQKNTNEQKLIFDDNTNTLFSQTALYKTMFSVIKENKNGTM